MARMLANIVREMNGNSLLHALDRYEADTFGVIIAETDEQCTLELLVKAAREDDINQELDAEALKERIKESKVEMCGDEMPMLFYLTWRRKRPEKVRKAENVYDPEDGFDEDEIDENMQVTVGNKTYDIEEYLEWNESRSEFLKTIEEMVEQ